MPKPKPAQTQSAHFNGKLIQHAPNVHELQFDNVAAGFEQWVFLSGDRHHDNQYCDWDLERKHLDECAEKRAPIIDCGDLFCAMQGKWDKRSDQNQMRPEHRVNKYLDALVSTAADFYEPYAGLFALLGRGNHETSITGHHGVDLTSNLVYELNRRGGTAHAGGYGGWLTFHFIVNKTVRQSVRLKYFHGSGGGGPVTRGVIDTNRQSVFLDNADIVLNGHTHDAYILPIRCESLSVAHKVELGYRYFVRVPGYKDEYRDGAGGWHVERGAPPKPTGGAWLRFRTEGAKNRVVYDVIMADK